MLLVGCCVDGYLELFGGGNVYCCGVVVVVGCVVCVVCVVVVIVGVGGGVVFDFFGVGLCGGGGWYCL